jgi:hypothetical protein
VLDKTTGAPVAGGRVTTFDALRPLSGGHEYEARNATTTDAAGRFELRDVQVGDVSLAFDHRDYPRQTDGPFATVAGAVLERTVLMLGSARVHGVLADGEGKPVAGAKLALEFLGPQQIKRGGKTGAHGEFAFGFGLIAGSYRLERVFEPGDGPCLVAVTEVELELGADREVRLAPLGTCELTVAVGGGLALPPKTMIQLSFAGPDGRPTTVKAPLHEGRVAFAGLPAKACDAGVWTGSVGARDRIELRPGPRQTLELEVGRIR